ncbi:MAG: large subunit ribosomal protein L25 [Planctomycetota bacterium]|jgi:large subunit ribosomal protein L25
MEIAQMKAERRSALGRNQIKKLRAEGWMPAVVYGQGGEPISIQISEWELEQHLKSRHKVFNLDVAGTQIESFLQDVSYKTTNDRPLHADFLRISFDQPIETVLEIALLGHPAGLARGGVLVKDRLRIKVTALPTKLPEILEVKISGLNCGDYLRAKDLVLSDGVALAVDAEDAICHVTEAPVAKAEGDEEEAK